MTAPVQVLVLGFDEPAFSGEVLDELVRLRDAGVVRLLDLVLVARDEAGDFDVLTATDLMGGELGGAAAALLLGEPGPGTSPSTDEPDRWSLGDVVPPGSVAAVALLEHLWADPLAEAITRAGGRALDELWLSAADRDLLSRHLEEGGG